MNKLFVVINQYGKYYSKAGSTDIWESDESLAETYNETYAKTIAWVSGGFVIPASE